MRRQRVSPRRTAAIATAATAAATTPIWAATPLESIDADRAADERRRSRPRARTVPGQSSPSEADRERRAAERAELGDADERRLRAARRPRLEDVDADELHARRPRPRRTTRRRPSPSSRCSARGVAREQHDGGREQPRTRRSFAAVTRCVFQSYSAVERERVERRGDDEREERDGRDPEPARAAQPPGAARQAAAAAIATASTARSTSDTVAPPTRDARLVRDGHEEQDKRDRERPCREPVERDAADRGHDSP